MTNSNIQRRQIRPQSLLLGCEKRLSRTAQQQPFDDMSGLPHPDSGGTYNQILICLVWWLPFLFPSAHEPPAGDDTRFDLRKMDLHHHTFFASISVSDFRHSVAWSANFEEDFSLYVGLGRSYHQLGLFCIPGSSSGEVCLMLFPLRVCKI